MKTATTLSFALALALTGAGCANDSANPDDGNGSDDGSDDGSDTTPPPAKTMDATGTYRVHSTFDLGASMPAHGGGFVGALIDATNDPDDPMSWLLDQMLNQMADSDIKSFLVAAKPYVQGYLNDELASLAPELVSTIQQLGLRTGELTKKFGLAEKLTILELDQSTVGQVTVDGVRFEVQGVQKDFTFAAANIDDVTVSGTTVRLENESKLVIGAHVLPIPYNQLMRLGIDEVVIPSLYPSVHGLAGLLDQVVDCAGVGAGISTSLGFGSAAFWTSACHAGLNGAANFAYDQILDTTVTVDMHLNGTARAADTNQDYKIDTLTFGQWVGTTHYNAVDTTLAQPASFDGVRL